MFRKVISIVIASIIALSFTATAFAAEVDNSSAGAEVSDSAGAEVSGSPSAAGNVIYFDSTGWKNIKTVYCHIWQRGGDDFFGWQAKASVCKKESGNIYSFDLDKLNSSTYIEGGMKSDTDYCVIFSADTGAQTYDATLGTACIGDTLMLTDAPQIENPKDSEKTGYATAWKTNSAKYGPHLAITSIGNIVGKVLCPNESGIEVIGDWLKSFYESVYVDPTEALTKALPKFGVKDITAVYAYISSKTDEGLDTMQKILEDAYAKAYPSAEKQKVNKDKAKEEKKAIESGKDIKDLVETPADNGSDSSQQSYSSYQGSGDVSETGADGQEDTIFFVLAGIMIAALGVMFTARRKNEG